MLTPDTGYFWFFNPANIEVVVKVLDACSVDGYFWVFGGGLTNLGVQLTVTDTLTGVTKTYDNTEGPAFQPIQDTRFEACPAAPTDDRGHARRGGAASVTLARPRLRRTPVGRRLGVLHGHAVGLHRHRLPTLGLRRQLSARRSAACSGGGRSDGRTDPTRTSTPRPGPTPSPSRRPRAASTATASQSVTVSAASTTIAASLGRVYDRPERRAARRANIW